MGGLLSLKGKREEGRSKCLLHERRRWLNPTRRFAGVQRKCRSQIDMPCMVRRWTTPSRAWRWRCSAWAVSGAQRKASGWSRVSFRLRSGYSGGYTPNATYEEVCSGQTGHTEVVRVVFDPKVTSYDAMLRQFWEGHDPTQGMRQGADTGTQYRSAIYYYSDAQDGSGAVERNVSGKALGGRLRSNNNRNRACACLLLRRGLSPAIPCEESSWILRSRRHRCQLPGGRSSVAK